MDADLATTVVPYLTAAAAAYGTAVLDRVRDSAADATADASVGLGRRLLSRILGRQESADAVSEAVQDIVADPADPDRVSALRLQIRKALVADPQLASDVAHLVARSGVAINATGEGAVAVQHNSGIVQTGRGSHASQHGS
ncbi:hypothetical protein AB0J82_01765 [Asanoa sp. NPDC049518]|uniref:hypothetical protein n=1 Tax=unclassified Asanoa TaxID=2685164 RepID=UPI0034491A32